MSIIFTSLKLLFHNSPALRNHTPTLQKYSQRLWAHHSPAFRESRLSQLVGDAVRGQKCQDNQRSQAKANIFKINFTKRFLIWFKTVDYLGFFDPSRF